MAKRCFCSDAVFSRGLELVHPELMQLVWKGKALFYVSHNTSGWGKAILCQELKQAKSSKGGRDRHSSALAKPEKEMGENPRRRTETSTEGLVCDILYKVTRAEPGNRQPHKARPQCSVCKGLLSISSSMTLHRLLSQLLEIVMSVYPFSLFRNRRCCALLDFFNALLSLDHKLVISVRRHW